MGSCLFISLYCAVVDLCCRDLGPCSQAGHHMEMEGRDKASFLAPLSPPDPSQHQPTCSGKREEKLLPILVRSFELLLQICYLTSEMQDSTLLGSESLFEILLGTRHYTKYRCTVLAHTFCLHH